MIELHINPNSKVPIYVQIEEQLRSLIAAGKLRPGDQLPTIRQLAADLRVNYNTIARAYLELDRAGIISTRRGRGTFVAGQPDEEQMRRIRQEKLRMILRSALDEARALGYSSEEITRTLEQMMT